MTAARWPATSLGDVIEDTQYGTSTKANTEGNGVPVLRMNNITYRGALDLDDLKHVELHDKELDQYTVRRGDLLFNRTNSHELVGKTAVWNRDEPYAFAGYLVRLRIDRKRADPAFIAAWFNTSQMKTLLRTRAKPSINMANINATEVLKFPVPLPPLNEQRRIAEVLDLAEALRTKRAAALAQLDTLTQSIFLDLMAASGSNVATMPIDAAMEAIIDYRGKSPKKTTGGIPLVTARVVKGGVLLEPNEFIAEGDYASWMSRGLPRAGDVLFTTEAPLGEVAQLDHRQVALAQRLLLLRGRKDILDNTFLMHALTSKQVRDQIFARSTGSTVRGIRQKELRKVTIPVPPLPLQQAFGKRAARVEGLKAVQRRSLAELDALFASLQHRAFRGEL